MLKISNAKKTKLIPATWLTVFVHDALAGLVEQIGAGSIARFGAFGPLLALLALGVTAARLHVARFGVLARTL